MTPLTSSSVPLDDITSQLNQLSISPLQHVPLTGLFDKYSFMEVLGGWGKGVITGRARLGGIPVGVVCVDVRTTEYTIPADPALVESKENIVSRPGQVWYPESSFKTAQAIFDMRCEDLPIIILANWRGFSGGQESMQDAILKFGSYIVDALHNIEHPVMIYLPPMSTLRGGSMVVVDPTINKDFMEIYADPTSRCNVLEPDGIIDIKFRREQILAEMRRCDPYIIQYTQQLTVARAAKDVNLVQNIQSIIKTRENSLYPTYLQLAMHFADLHDTPVRMQHKGCLDGIVEWGNGARNKFYWRIKAKQFEHEIVTVILFTLLNKNNNNNNNNNHHNVLPNTSNTYQHEILWELLSTKYSIPLLDRSLPTTATSTHASTIQLARALFNAWLQESTLPIKIIPSFTITTNNNINTDQIFVEYIINNYSSFYQYIYTKCIELQSFKTSFDLKQMLTTFTKEQLLEMIDKL
jgi:hypothetical protein